MCDGTRRGGFPRAERPWLHGAGYVGLTCHVPSRRPVDRSRPGASREIRRRFAGAAPPGGTAHVSPGATRAALEVGQDGRQGPVAPLSGPPGGPRFARGHAGGPAWPSPPRVGFAWRPCGPPGPEGRAVALAGRATGRPDTPNGRSTPGVPLHRARYPALASPPNGWSTPGMRGHTMLPRCWRPPPTGGQRQVRPVRATCPNGWRHP